MKALNGITLGLTLVAALVFSGNISAEIDDSDPAKVKENVEKCKKLLREHCGSRSFKECSKKKDKKTAQVGKCVSYMAKHRKAFDIGELNPDFQSLVKSFSSPGQDGKKCMETAKLVCGEDVDLKVCMRQFSGRFPSFCREFAENKIGHMEAAYKNDPGLRGCTDNLMAKCKGEANLGKDDEPNAKVIMAGMAKYEACLMKAIKTTPGCAEVVKMDKKTPPSKSIQLINGQ